MILFISVIHVFTALLLIVVVLLQDAKGGGAFGIGGGGGSNQILSSTGTANFLVNLTRGLAVLFAATSITLTYMTTTHTGSVTDSYIPPAATKTAIPAAAPTAPKAPSPRKGK